MMKSMKRSNKLKIMNDILKKDITGITKEASAINPPPAEEPITAETIHNIVDDYFNTHEDPYIRSAYTKGQIFSLKDDFDFIRFFKSIIHVFQERMTENSNGGDNSQQLKATFTTLDKCIDILKTCNMDKDGSEILPILINYCLSSFSRYNKSYVKSRKIQK